MGRIDFETGLGLRDAVRLVPHTPQEGNKEPAISEIDEAALNNDRINRAIVVAARGAIDRLLGLGWSRRSVRLEIPSEDPLPCWVLLRKRRVFEIRLVPYADGRIDLQGEWIDSVSPPTIVDRFMGH